MAVAFSDPFRAQGVPRWLRLLVKGLLLGSTATVVFNGSASTLASLIARGVTQGCPTRGSIWALAFDPVVRTVSCAAAAIGGSSVFADDIAAALWDILRDMATLAPILARMRAAAGLQLNFAKTAIINYGTVPTPPPTLRDDLGLSGICVHAEGVSLGFVLSPTVGDNIWTAALWKSLSRVVFVRQVPGFTGDRLLRLRRGGLLDAEVACPVACSDHRSASSRGRLPRHDSRCADVRDASPVACWPRTAWLPPARPLVASRSASGPDQILELRFLLHRSTRRSTTTRPCLHGELNNGYTHRVWP